MSVPLNLGIKSTLDKALELNLDPAVYGTFAEIGAGQETANWFFRASATAGTMAKSISAYDMTMSDAIYGRCDRYVSRGRLQAMLEYEYDILVERLGPKRGENTTFFSFANTVRARGYQDTAECHGWIGIRFQQRPGEEPCDICLHVRLLDLENNEQSEALGILGVNLIYAAYRHRLHLKQFVESLVDNLLPGRIEVDLLAFQGGGFGYVDNRLCALQLVESGLTDAALFTPDGSVVPPAELLYKRPILLLRGSFDPVLQLHLEALRQGRETFTQQLAEGESANVIELCEITMHNLLRSGSVDSLDFLDRADALQALGKTVMISRAPEFHRIASLLSRYTTRPIGILLSIGLLNELFKEKWSENLAGGILESFGRLFKQQVSLYVFPWKNRATGELVTAETFRAPEHLHHLYSHFFENKLIRSVPCPNEDLLRWTGRDLKRMIAEGDQAWRSFVPEVAHRSALHMHGTEE